MRTIYFPDVTTGDISNQCYPLPQGAIESHKGIYINIKMYLGNIPPNVTS